MIKVELETVVMIVVIIALLIGVQQYVAPRMAEALQERLSEAVEVGKVSL
jgi:hypothetical protein